MTTSERQRARRVGRTGHFVVRAIERAEADGAKPAGWT